MLLPPLVLDFPALPVLGDSHSLLPSGVKALGPLLGRGRAKTQGIVELLRDVCYMLLVIVLPDFDVCGRGRGLQRVRGNVVVVVGEEGKRKRGSQRRGR